MNQAEVRIPFPSAKEAEAARSSLAPDDSDGASSHVEGTELVLVAESGTVMGLLRSLDDQLGCLRATGID